MNPFHKSIHSLSRGLICGLAIAIVHPALCETTPPQDAKGLLNKARQSEYERKMGLKQTELDRLSEDLKKGKQQGEGLQKMIDSVGAAIVEANGRLDRVTAQRNHQPKVMEIISLKYEADKMRVDGLRMLEGAQTKALTALARHNEVIDLRTTLGSLDMKTFAEKALTKPGEADVADSGSKKSQSGGELRKALANAERAASAAEIAAREAMQAATAKLQQADAAAEKTEQRRIELGIDDISNLPGDSVVPAPQVAPKKGRSKR